MEFPALSGTQLLWLWLALFVGAGLVAGFVSEFMQLQDPAGQLPLAQSAP